MKETERKKEMVYKGATFRKDGRKNEKLTRIDG